jgi:hypothetical protein
MISLCFPIKQIGENPLLRLPKRPPAKNFDECREFSDLFCRFCFQSASLQLTP